MTLEEINELTKEWNDELAVKEKKLRVIVSFDSEMDELMDLLKSTETPLFDS